MLVVMLEVFQLLPLQVVFQSEFSYLFPLRLNLGCFLVDVVLESVARRAYSPD